jgi:hypothetical protein
LTVLDAELSDQETNVPAYGDGRDAEALSDICRGVLFA